MAQLHRGDVLREIDETFPDSPIVLTLGGTAREMLAVAGRKSNHLINLDAMGQTIAIAAGLAIGLDEGPAEKTVVVEGDGSFLMGLSIVSTIGHLKPSNLVVIVLDNGVYLATGAQPTAAVDMDMGAVVRASGWAASRDVESADELAAALEWARTEPGPLLIRVAIDTAQLKTDFFLEDPVVIASDFRRWLESRSPTK
jgi:thiamine pyrophosphate-dependent acetolactate synthase large subunit-like protein